MRVTGMIGVLVAVLAAVLATQPASAEAADAGLARSLDVVAATNRSAAASQQKIDQLSQRTQALLQEYRQLRESADYEAAYRRELEQTDKQQRSRIAQLEQQITEARVTRQRIVPLLRSMADALEKFVALDLPFHQTERVNAVLSLKQRIEQPELPIADKFRLLLEIYQLESDYGNTVEAWRGPLQYKGEERSVEFLRIGRMALYFQSLDGQTNGYWDAAEGRWTELADDYQRSLALAVRVAKKLTAPTLLQLPLRAAAGDAS